MKTLAMQKFGKTLTDRPYGKSVAESILREESFPLLLDFSGVVALGSSFGDEILAAIGPKQDRHVMVKHANGAVRSCLQKVAGDTGVTIEFTQ